MLFLTACVVPSDDTGRLLDTSGVAPPPVHAAPTLDAAEVAAALDAVLALGLPSPLPPVALWVELLAQRDEACPNPDAPAGTLMANTPCTAVSGYTYQGYGAGSAGALDRDGDGEPELYRLGLLAEGVITDPDGQAFRFGAEARFDQQLTGSESGSYTGEIAGSLVYPVHEAAWLAAGVSSALTFGGLDQGGGTWGMHLDGGYTVGETSLSFTGFSVYEACPQGPAGTIGLRGPEGGWYDLTFDACDGCGEVTYDGDTPLGRACVAVTPAFDAAWAGLSAARDAAAVPP